MADYRLRLGTSAGLSALGIVLGASLGDRELTRSSLGKLGDNVNEIVDPTVKVGPAPTKPASAPWVPSESVGEIDETTGQRKR